MIHSLLKYYYSKRSKAAQYPLHGQPSAANSINQSYARNCWECQPLTVPWITVDAPITFEVSNRFSDADLHSFSHWSSSLCLKPTTRISLICVAEYPSNLYRISHHCTASTFTHRQRDFSTNAPHMGSRKSSASDTSPGVWLDGLESGCWTKSFFGHRDIDHIQCSINCWTPFNFPN